MSEQSSKQYWKNYYSTNEGGLTPHDVNAGASSTTRSPAQGTSTSSSRGGYHPHYSGTSNDRQYYRHSPPSGCNFVSYGKQKDPASSRPSNDTPSMMMMMDTTHHHQEQEPSSSLTGVAAGSSPSNLETSTAAIQNENSHGRTNNVSPSYQNTIGRYPQQMVPTSDDDIARSTTANNNNYYHYNNYYYANSNRMSQGHYRGIDDSSSHCQRGRKISNDRFLHRSSQYTHDNSTSSHRMDSSSTNDAVERSRYYDKSAGHSYYEVSNLDHSHHRHYNDDRMQRNASSRYAFDYHSKMEKRNNQTSSFASPNISSDSPNCTNYTDAPSSCKQVSKSHTNISSHPSHQQHSASMVGDRPRRISSFNHHTWDHPLRHTSPLHKINDGGNFHHTHNFKDAEMNSSKNEGGDQYYGYGSISRDGRFFPHGRSLGSKSTTDDVRESCKEDVVVGDNNPGGQESDNVRQFTTPSDSRQISTTTNDQEQQDHTGSYTNDAGKVSDNSPDDVSKHHGPLIDDNKKAVKANSYDENKEEQVWCKSVNYDTVSGENTARKPSWKCDVCLVARFLNYGDAVQHEKQCRGSREEGRIAPISIQDETTKKGRFGSKDVTDDSKNIPETVQTRTTTIEVENLSLDCHHCEKSFSSLQNLIAHKSECPVHGASLTKNNSNETPKGLYICDFCGKGFKTYSEADEHEKNCSSLQQKSTCFTRSSKKIIDVKSFTCHICSASFSTYTEGKIHERKCSKQIAKSISNSSNMIKDSQEERGECTANDSNAGDRGTFIDSSICKQVERNDDHDNKIKNRKLFVCDVCNIASFNTLSEALHHKKTCEKLCSGKQLDHDSSDPASVINTNKGYQLNDGKKVNTNTIPIIENKLMLVDDSMMESTKGQEEEKKKKPKCVAVVLQQDTSQQPLQESNKRISDEVHSTDSPLKRQKLGNNSRLCILCGDGSSTLLPQLDSVPLVASFFTTELSQLSLTSRTLLNHVEIVDNSTSKHKMYLRCRCCNSDEYTEPFSRQINSIETMHETIDRFRCHLKSCQFFPKKGDSYTLVKPKKEECMKLMRYCKLLSEAYGIVNNSSKSKGVTWGTRQYCLSDYNSSPGELVLLEEYNSGTKSTVKTDIPGKKSCSDVMRLNSNVTTKKQSVNTVTLTKKGSGSESVSKVFLLTDHNYIIVRSVVFIRKYAGKSSTTGLVNVNLFSQCRYCSQPKACKSIDQFTSEHVHQHHRHLLKCIMVPPPIRKALEESKNIHKDQKKVHETTSIAEYGRTILTKFYGIYDNENRLSQRYVSNGPNIEGVKKFGRKLNDHSKLPRNWVKLEMELPFYLKDYASPVSKDLPGILFGSSDR